MSFSCLHHHMFIAGGMRGTTCYYCGALMSQTIGDYLATAPADACMDCAEPAGTRNAVQEPGKLSASPGASGSASGVECQG